MFSSARFCVRCGSQLGGANAERAAANIFTAGLTPRMTPGPAAATTVEEIDQGFEIIEADDDAPSIDVTPSARTAEAVPERAESRRSQEMAEYSKDEVLRRVRNKQGLKRAGLSGIDLAGASLEAVDMGRAELDGAILANAKLTRAILRSATLRGAVLTGADLGQADLGRADLSGAKLAGARLAGADLSHADLTDADLTGADLTGVDLRQAALDGAIVEGARFDQAKLGNATIDGMQGRPLVAEWIDVSPDGDGNRLDAERALAFLTGKKERVDGATRYFGKGDILRDATLEFGAGSVIHVDSRFENCSIALGDGAELTIGEPGILKNCAIVGRGNIVVHGRFFERASPGIVGPKSLVVSTGGAVVGSVEQTGESTSFAFEPGCRLRVKILKPRQPLAAE
jgi:uncharacterized protein YjbI with pentapeptide repeats